MNRDWILQTNEIRRTFANATWVPLRASQNKASGIKRESEIGYVGEFFGCGSVAFPPQYREVAERLSWHELGIAHSARPYAYKDGCYSPIDEYQYNDKESIGVELVFVHDQPVVGGTIWILNPDLVVALGLIKEGNNWVRPEEDFVVVAREFLDEDGNYQLIEIKRAFLIDYLAARGLALRLSYYRQHFEIVSTLDGTDYEGLENYQCERNQGRFELIIRSLDNIHGGSWASFRVWRTDVDEEEDAPVLGPVDDKNTKFEQSEGVRAGPEGVRIEGEFWRDEWIDHQELSVRVRGDADQTLPNFIVETDGARAASSTLNDENVGRWLWFRSSVVTELLSHRGFSLRWYTAETGGIGSTSGYATHFGINTADLVTVYAYDIARLAAWEQHLWAAHNVAPDGKVSVELLSSQVKAQVASTYAVEELFFVSMRMLEQGFRKRFDVDLFNHNIDDKETIQQVTRFQCRDQASLLRLAKEIIRVFSDRLNVRELRKLSTHTDRNKLGSNKLLQDILAKEVGEERARLVLGPVVGAYELRLGDAHPTGSKIGEALKLAGIDESRSPLRQGEQLIHNVGHAIWLIGKLLFEKQDNA
ncbi:hypothetical protein IV99_14360 [Pectobacterium brasiliense]|uniref:hypothetical protein n=1 Tax=Pectobacterium brasiliense TaxID=180957 RepID=UPI0004E688C8|nr:hypothetical protein [Pectobacterium brasiliense]KFF62608.1 hypothetical protein IV99_14360 [Pectobacterium brasiliense]